MEATSLIGVDSFELSCMHSESPEGLGETSSGEASFNSSFSTICNESLDGVDETSFSKTFCFGCSGSVICNESLDGVGEASLADMST